MKTKIMLSIVVMLAVAFIGLARPTSAAADAPRTQRAAVAPAEQRAAASSPASPAAPPSEVSQSQVAAPAARQETSQTAEKKKEKKHIFLIQNKEGKTIPIEITVGEGDVKKTIMADIPLTFQKDADGTVILIVSGGKELRFEKGETLRLEIKGDNLEIVKEGKVYDLGKDIDRPTTIRIKGVDKDVSQLTAWSVQESDDKLAQKLREAQEILKKAKEEKGSGQDNEKTLKEIEEKLKEMEEISHSGLKSADEPAGYVIVERKKDGPDSFKHIAFKETSGQSMFIVADGKKGELTLIHTPGPEAITREVYERIADRIKKSLPEGFTVESEFDEGSGRITLKVKEPTGQKMPRDLIRKLVDDILEAKKAEAKK